MGDALDAASFAGRVTPADTFALLPLYEIARWIPSVRESANRLRPVRLESVLAAPVHAVENPARGVRILETPDLRAARLSSGADQSPGAAPAMSSRRSFACIRTRAGFRTA